MRGEKGHIIRTFFKKIGYGSELVRKTGSATLGITVGKIFERRRGRARYLIKPLDL